VGARAGTGGTPLPFDLQDKRARECPRVYAVTAPGPWHAAQPVRIGYVEPLNGKDLHDIPANWRQLADVDPPEMPGWGSKEIRERCRIGAVLFVVGVRPPTRGGSKGKESRS
jgi:hypothetical protein